MQLGGSDDDGIDEDVGDLDQARVEGPGGNDPLDLNDDLAAVVAGGAGHGEVVEGERLALHGDVAVLVGGGAAQEGDVDGGGAVEQQLLTAEMHDLDKVVSRALVDSATLGARVDEGMQTDPRDRAGQAGGHVAVEPADDALGEVPPLDLTADGESRHTGNQPPVATDDPAQQARLGEPVEALFSSVTLSGREEQGEPGRVAALTEAPSQPVEEGVGGAAADEA